MIPGNRTGLCAAYWLASEKPPEAACCLAWMASAAEVTSASSFWLISIWMLEVVGCRVIGGVFDSRLGVSVERHRRIQMVGTGLDRIGGGVKCGGIAV